MGTIPATHCPSDQDFLWEMLYQAVYVPPGSPPLPREIIRQPELAHYVQGWPQPGDLGLIATEVSTGNPLGAAWLRLFSPEDPATGSLRRASPS